MATRQGLDSSIVNRLGADEQALFFAVKAEFDTDDILVWSGIDDLVIGSDTYTGAGTLLSVSNSEDNLELKSNGLVVALSGMDTTVVNYALTENYQNRPITIFMGYVMGGTNEVAGTLTLFKGRMTSLVINDTPEGSTVTIDAEIDWQTQIDHQTLDTQKNHKTFCIQVIQVLTVLHLYKTNKLIGASHQVVAVAVVVDQLVKMNTTKVIEIKEDEETT